MRLCVGWVRNPASSFLASPKGRDRVLHPPPALKSWCPRVVGVRTPYSSFFATPKSRDWVLHLPQAKRRGGARGLEIFDQGVVVGAPLSSRRVASPKIRGTEPFPQGHFECGADFGVQTRGVQSSPRRSPPQCKVPPGGSPRSAGRRLGRTPIPANGRRVAARRVEPSGSRTSRESTSWALHLE